MSFVVYLFVQGVIRKYGGKAHTLGLHRDINVCANFSATRRVQKPHERVEDRAGPAIGCPPYPQGARPPLLTNQHESHGLCSTASEDQGKPFDQGRFDPTTHVHLRGLYKQGPWPLKESNPIIH